MFCCHHSSSAFACAIRPCSILIYLPASLTMSSTQRATDALHFIHQCWTLGRYFYLPQITKSTDVYTCLEKSNRWYMIVSRYTFHYEERNIKNASTGIYDEPTLFTLHNTTTYIITTPVQKLLIIDTSNSIYPKQVSNIIDLFELKTFSNNCSPNVQIAYVNHFWCPST